MKKRGLCVAALCVFLCAAGCAAARPKAYGVFIGINGEEADRLRGYQLVVIEPSAFTGEQIERLRSDGKTVYGYLNIGALEEYRPYHDRFQDLILGVYEDWPDEGWIDVADPGWQSFIIDELGGQYTGMGLDGLFLDNADVYYNYPTEEIFQGICAILRGLRQYHIPLIINGGDTFVSRCMEDNAALFDGVNQETVFTAIDFDDRSCGRQKKEETDYFKAYLSKVKEGGLSVFLLEYGADGELAREIDAYCAGNGFLWYNAEDIELR
ncbi:MAG: endo alpha-1,4 polygalactosaminidase [Christensenellales bacterium]|jgi:endo-alpha-1,4-polygalactosaminidase (GH114 family)